MTVVSLEEAEAQLARLLREVEEGEDVVISRDGEPVARLTRVVKMATRRELGRDRGLFEVPDDFNDSLPPEVLVTFEG